MSALAMNDILLLEQLLALRPSPILFECVGGSRAYGTVTATSDEDIRGIFGVPAASYLALAPPQDQVSDERGNVVYYSLRRTIELLAVANPNLLELLFMPDDCVRKSSASMQRLQESRHLFVSRQCADTHINYAMSQIKKARGQNKWVNHPKPPEPPVKEDYCYVIPWDRNPDRDAPPARPMSLRSAGWSLDEFHAARLEHSRDIFRLYRYGKAARGVFRGGMLVLESIPREDEATCFAGFLLYNEQAWQQALVEHQNYWAWRRDRNPTRWQQQELGELDFDSKNMMHTVRLLLSGRSIMECGQPAVRFAGESLELLLSIRAGQLSFDQILSIAEGLQADCERLKARSDLPDRCDPAEASRLLQSLTSAWEAELA